MARILLTGATGGIGKHVASDLANKHVVHPLSRTTSVDGVFASCDLVNEVPQLAEQREGEDAPKIDWIVHLATTYKVADDLAMLDNLIAFAKEHRVDHFLYVSSWVVHFPHRPISASYIEMKRRCEERLLASELHQVQIVRPSVVVGDNLSWTKTLKRLAPWSPLIPHGFSRSFVTVDEVSEVIGDVIAGKQPSPVITVLGRRQPLAEKAAEHQEEFGAWPCWLAIVVGVAALFVITGKAVSPDRYWPTVVLVFLVGGAFWMLLPKLLGCLSDYFAGFVERRFEPSSERDVVALCNRVNDNIRVRGYDNARLYFQRPTSPRHTTVCLKRFCKTLEIDVEKQVAHVQAGANFGHLLPQLESRGLWLENYPNYHFISVGACIATAVHGSNLDKPFLADLVNSIRFYDRDQGGIVTLQRDDPGFGELIFNRVCPQNHIVLSAELQLCPRQYYELTTVSQPIEKLRFENIADRSTNTQHYEVRINSPHSRNAYLQSYRQFSSGESCDSAVPMLRIKADSIGRKWNMLQKNAAMSFLTSSISGAFINYEWFFTPEEFQRFWHEISGDRKRYRLYKLLVRYNREQSHLNTPYHGTVSIDVTIRNTKRMLGISTELFEKFRPLEHLGKYSIERYMKKHA
ncbi:MAG: FAD-binding protein [Rhodopirellula sp. JB044]|uniref:FAD-binding protein n=1 Tax=Rhodopirellula sp. JB044 TaxID=3342844 RepID=UPI00370BCF56